MPRSEVEKYAKGKEGVRGKQPLYKHITEHFLKQDGHSYILLADSPIRPPPCLKRFEGDSYPDRAKTPVLAVFLSVS